MSRAAARVGVRANTAFQLSLSDNFNRADGPLTTTPAGAPYTLYTAAGSGVVQVQSNRATLGAAATSADVGFAYLNTGVLAHKISIETPVISPFSDGTRYLRLIVRATPDNMRSYFVQWSRSVANWLYNVYEQAASTTNIATGDLGSAVDPASLSCSITAAGVLIAVFTRPDATTSTVTVATDNIVQYNNVGFDIYGTGARDNLSVVAP